MTGPCFDGVALATHSTFHVHRQHQFIFNINININPTSTQHQLSIETTNFVLARLAPQREKQHTTNKIPFKAYSRL
jgi:hypothetical protein